MAGPEVKGAQGGHLIKSGDQKRFLEGDKNVERELIRVRQQGWIGNSVLGRGNSQC